MDLGDSKAHTQTMLIWAEQQHAREKKAKTLSLYLHFIHSKSHQNFFSLFFLIFSFWIWFCIRIFFSFLKKRIMNEWILFSENQRNWNFCEIFWKKFLNFCQVFLHFSFFSLRVVCLFVCLDFFCCEKKDYFSIERYGQWKW